MRKLKRWMLAVIPSVCALALSGAAGAQVPNGVWEIVDKNDSDSRAEAVLTDGFYALAVDAMCVPFPDGDSTTGSAIEARSDRADRVKLKKDSGDVEQGEKSNPGIIRFRTGSGIFETVTEFECKKLSMQAGVDTKKTPNEGDFEVKASDCECTVTGNPDCEPFLSQAATLVDDCASMKSVKIDLSSKDPLVTKIRIKGKGEATPEAGD